MAARRKKMNAAALKALRYAKGMNQIEFWIKIGVTQSGGSRYENGKRMPVPVALLVDLVHVRGINVTKLKHEDMAVLQFMEESQPYLYTALLKGMRDAPRKTRHA